MKRREAVDVAARALAARDLSRAALAARLEAAGVTDDEREAALDRLTAAGFVDDGRTARSRGGRLAVRGWGDAGIAAKLAAEGIDRETIDTVLAELPAERDRAIAVAAGSAIPHRRLVTQLARRGFGEDAIEAAIASLDVADEPELR